MAPSVLDRDQMDNLSCSKTSTVAGNQINLQSLIHDDSLNVTLFPPFHPNNPKYLSVEFWTAIHHQHHTDSLLHRQRRLRDLPRSPRSPLAERNRVPVGGRALLAFPILVGLCPGLPSISVFTKTFELDSSIPGMPSWVQQLAVDPTGS
jgi:hypothetical protein